MSNAPLPAQRPAPSLPSGTAAPHPAGDAAPPAASASPSRPRRRAHVPVWYHSPLAAWLGLAVLVVWGFLLPGKTPVGGDMGTAAGFSLFAYSLFSVVGGIVFLSNRDLGRALSSCVAVGLLVFWGWLFVRYSGADWSRLAYVFFNFEILGENGLKALAGGFVTTLEVGAAATLCAFWLGVALTLVRFFENKVMSGFVRAYVDVFRALPTIVLVSLIHYGAPFIGIYLPLMVSGILTLTLNHSAFFSEILRSGVNAVGRGQLEAARSLGLGTFRTFRLIVFPQAFRTAMPPLAGQFVALLKETVICSVVGIPELLREALVVQSWTANPTPLILATLGYMVLLVPLTRLSRRLETRLSTVRPAAC